jgi:glucosamine-6-phosphate deaminase
MRIILAENYDLMSEKAAGFIAAQIYTKPNSVLGLATGSTPIGVYSNLIKWHKQGYLSFKECNTVNLDEYCGLPADHPQRYAYFMNEYLFQHIDIKRENTHFLNGLCEDAEAECAAYDQLIESLGGIDFQLLGIGNNGHIGFNEPDTCYHMNTNRVNLTPSTIQANSRFFGREEDVPKQAYTMGLRPIVQAKQVLMVVSGKHKAETIYQSLFGPVTPMVPGSILQVVPNLIVCGDADALSIIAEKHPQSVEFA